MSQERLAEKSELNYKYIGRIELAKADPGAGVLIRLAGALEVPVGELFETITPSTSLQYRLAPADLKEISDAVATLKTTVDRVLARQPRPTPKRAPRKSRH